MLLMVSRSLGIKNCDIFTGWDSNNCVMNSTELDLDSLSALMLVAIELRGGECGGLMSSAMTCVAFCYLGGESVWTGSTARLRN